MFSTNQVASEVLARYPIPTSYSLISLGNGGGFSGAHLWQLESAGKLCLRAWPPSGVSATKLGEIHRLMDMARKSGLGFIPTVLVTRTGQTLVDHGDRLWDLTTWMPGRADFHDRPTTARLERACTALAQLHAAWAGETRVSGTCPAVQRRLDCARDWKALTANGWRANGQSLIFKDLFPQLVNQSLKILEAYLDQAIVQLAEWRGVALMLQPCLCDIWHDHVLFQDDTVSGFIDFGSVKIDHVAVDVARLLGSLVQDDMQDRMLGLRAYSRVRPLSGVELDLIKILDRTGALLAIANWLMWLADEGRKFEDRGAVMRRISELIQRTQRWREKE